MPAGFIENYTGGESGVEGLDSGSGDVDGDGVALMFLRGAAPFVADKDGGGLIERNTVYSFFSARMGRVEGNLALLDFLVKGFPIGKRERCPEQRAGGGAERLGIPGAYRPFQKYDAAAPERFRRADDGAGVARILNAIKRDDKGVAI